MKHRIYTVLALFALNISSYAADDPITGTWRFWNNSIREMRADGSSSPPGRPNDAIWKCLNPQSPTERGYEVNYGNGKAFDRLTLRNGNGELWGMNGKRPFLTARREADSKPAKPVGKKSTKTAPSVPFGGMDLGGDWKPTITHIKVKELEQLESLAKIALRGVERGKEPVPEFIVPPFKWLMPLNEAMGLLPQGVAKVPMQKFENDCFPCGSLGVQCFQYTYFLDLGARCNLIYLISDLKGQLVSVQLKAEAIPSKSLLDRPLEVLRTLPNPYGPGAPTNDGSGGLYYDFLNEGEGSPTYQVRTTTDKSNALIHLMHRHKNVHWYVPAPFARVLVDIAEHYREAGVIK